MRHGSGVRPVVATVLAGLLSAIVTAGAATAAAQDRYALIVSGASGGEPRAEKHAAWRQALIEKLRETFGFESDHLVVLAETPEGDAAVSTRENVRAAAEQLRGRITEDDLLLVVLIGHGTFDGVDAKFNLVGPDLEAGEWADLLRDLAGRLVLVNTTEASFPFLERLSGPRRIVMTATDSAAQRFETVFPEFFVNALDDAATDIDKNGRVSLWEVFIAASAGVRHHYEQRGQLSTERALLDDNGDGVGKEAGAPGTDGPLASQVYLDAQPAPVTSDPELIELLQRQVMLVARAEELKVRKPLMPEGEYARELERLMIELARVSRTIRKKSS